MDKLSLKKLFGKGAEQTATHLMIKKTDLKELLAIKDNNSAEQLLAALILKAEKVLKPGQMKNNPKQLITIENSFQLLVTRNNQQYRQVTKLVNLQKLNTAGGIDSDDY